MKSPGEQGNPYFCRSYPSALPCFKTVISFNYRVLQSFAIGQIGLFTLKVNNGRRTRKRKMSQIEVLYKEGFSNRYIDCCKNEEFKECRISVVVVPFL